MPDGTTARPGGRKRYAHIAGVRGHAVAAKALGLQGMVRAGSVRRPVKAIQPGASGPRMRQAPMWPPTRTCLADPAMRCMRSG